MQSVIELFVYLSLVTISSLFLYYPMSREYSRCQIDYGIVWLTWILSLFPFFWIVSMAGVIYWIYDKGKLKEEAIKYLAREAERAKEQAKWDAEWDRRMNRTYKNTIEGECREVK